MTPAQLRELARQVRAGEVSTDGWTWARLLGAVDAQASDLQRRITHAGGAA